eukprot:9060046-Pyramimonas_sp.AAC.1
MDLAGCADVSHAIPDHCPSDPSCHHAQRDSHGRVFRGSRRDPTDRMIKSVMLPLLAPHHAGVSSGETNDRGGASGVLRAPLPLLAQEDP